MKLYKFGSWVNVIVGIGAFIVLAIFGAFLLSLRSGDLQTILNDFNIDANVNQEMENGLKAQEFFNQIIPTALNQKGDTSYNSLTIDELLDAAYSLNYNDLPTVSLLESFDGHVTLLKILGDMDLYLSGANNVDFSNLDIAYEPIVRSVGESDIKWGNLFTTLVANSDIEIDMNFVKNVLNVNITLLLILVWTAFVWVIIIQFIFTAFALIHINNKLHVGEEGNEIEDNISRGMLIFTGAFSLFPIIITGVIMIWGACLNRSKSDKDKEENSKKLKETKDTDIDTNYKNFPAIGYH